VDTATFDRMSRDELVAKARSLGVERAELMTRVELHDEIVRRSEPDPGERKKARGWLGVARDLVAGVVESGLNLPDAAALIRGRGEIDAQGPSPVATVTLAQIYAAQGHHARAIAVLDEVLAKEPDHPAARALRERFLESPPAASKPIEPQAAIPSFDAVPASPPVNAVETAEQPLSPFPELQPEPVLDEPALAPAPAAVLAPMPVQPVAAAPDVDAPPIVVTPPPRTAARPPCVLVTRSAGVRPEVVWDLGDLPGPGAGVALAIRYVSWTPSPSGVDRREGELFVNERRGRKRLAEVDPRAVVRVVFGHGRNDDFVPLGIASELAVRDGVVDLRFRPPTATDAEIQPFERELALGVAS
jgi:hypothetical protein